ncbi:MAG: zinc-binding protein [Chloroflexi bacterium]|jgi:CxxC-x17-CxxC domain-containing protein|nr:zinc-binding protein [Chloroflexota bacterium]MBT7080077.1 zinc-binding protein [Chloroflexota bacterium]MBT7290446.1 zinc-binding protein [Chloroflexota bacterium]
MEDKTLQCFDCGDAFTFSAEEQEFFQSKGFVNEPKRCGSCRAARKSQRGGGGFGGGTGGRRQMYPAVCAQCGKDTEVPFEPRNGRPVYCSDCYSKVSQNRY